MANLENDLLRLGGRVLDAGYALELYRAMCNVVWRYGDRPGEEWMCSWRMAGEIVADLRAAHSSGAIREDYLDWYCSGGEGAVTDRIRDDLHSIGWHRVD